MNYTSIDSQELQATWEQLILAIEDLKSSSNLTQMEIEKKAEIVRRLNRKYEVLNTRVKYNRIQEIKLQNKNYLLKFLRGILIGISIGILYFVLFGINK